MARGHEVSVDVDVDVDGHMEATSWCGNVRCRLLCEKLAPEQRGRPRSRVWGAKLWSDRAASHLVAGPRESSYPYSAEILVDGYSFSCDSFVLELRSVQRT